MPTDEIAGGEDPQNNLEQRERQELIGYLIQRLPEECRSLWDLVYRQRLAAETIGRRLGLTANAVRVRVHRCLEKARKIYREYAACPVAVNGGG